MNEHHRRKDHLAHLYGQCDTLTEVLIPCSRDPLLGKVSQPQVLKGLLCLDVEAHGRFREESRRKLGWFLSGSSLKFPPKVYSARDLSWAGVGVGVDKFVGGVLHAYGRPI